VNGCCLTVIEKLPEGISVDASRETLDLTTLGEFQAGTRVNLESALTLSTPLGGHLVSGHVDGVGVVQSRRADARSVRFDIEAPIGLAHYIARKGSICVDGVSLTVNAVEARRFQVNIIPHTLEHTNMRDYRAGTRVNLEVDLIARYLERLLSARLSAK
jgi:riboflavin synthase